MSYSEKELILQCQSGNTEAFGLLYDKHIRTIYNFVFYKTKNKDVAEDLTSQTFLKALNKIQSVDPTRPFVSWLYKIAQNTVFDHYRSLRHTETIHDVWDIADEENGIQVLDNEYDARRVQKYIGSLSGIERDIIFMRLWEELSYKDIAEIMGKTESNCKVIFSRALQKIRDKFFE